MKRSGRWPLVWAVVVTTSCGGRANREETAPESGRGLVLTNATLVDPETRTQRVGTLLLADGRVEAVLSGIPQTYSGRVIDLTGKWIIPGLHDLHTHSYGNMAPVDARFQVLGSQAVSRRMLYSGVSAFLDLGSGEDSILALRDRSRRDDFLGATAFVAGPLFTVARGHGTQVGAMVRLAPDPSEGVRQLRALLQRRPDAIKLAYYPSTASPGFPSLDRPTMIALVAEARSHRVPVVVHISTWEDAYEAVLAGATVITHLGGTTVPDSLVQLMVRRGAGWIPTLAVRLDLLRWVEHPEDLEIPLLQAVTTPDFLATFRDTSRFSSDAKGRVRRAQARRESYFESVRRMSVAGVPILVGTDGGNPGIFQGFSVHRELELLVQAGLSPWQALAAATVDAGRVLSRPVGFRRGSVADFVILDASPLESIGNTQRISGVVHRGRWIDRSALLAAF